MHRRPSRDGLVALGLSGLLAACAHEAPASSAAPVRELVLSYDDNRATGVLAFPNLTYESLVRFELPPGPKHRPVRLRALVASPGSLELTLYANSLLESPAEPLARFEWEVTASEVSNGKDGRWLVAELGGVAPLAGVLWVGVHKRGGDPALWTSSAASGQAFLRDRAPHNLLGILPVKRTPLLRLEFGY